MDEIREILKIKKGDISGSLDKLVQSVSDILTQKNNRIYDYLFNYWNNSDSLFYLF